MKKNTIITVLFSFFILIMLNVDLPANSIFLGNIESVYPDGAINALKNPALVAAQMEKSSLGLLLNYKAYHRTDVALDFNFLDNENTDNPVDERIQGGVAIGYTNKFGRTGIGIGFFNSGDTFYSRKKNESIFSGISPPSDTFTVITKGEETQINPGLSFSFGSEIGSNSFIGTRIMAGYSKITSDSDEVMTFTSGGVPSSSFSSTKQIKEIFSAEVQLGFYHVDKGDQVGFMIKGGRFSFVKSDLDYHYTDNIPTLVDGSSSITYYPQYNDGASFVMGGYSKLRPNMGIALEGEFQLPVSFKEKDYSKDDISHTYFVNDRYVSKDFGIQIKGGLEFIQSPQLSFAFGGGIAFFKSSSSESFNSWSESDYKGLYGTIGLVYNTKNGIRIMAGSVISWFTGDGINYSDDGTSTTILTIESSELNVESFIGVMYNL